MDEVIGLKLFNPKRININMEFNENLKNKLDKKKFQRNKIKEIDSTKHDTL